MQTIYIDISRKAVLPKISAKQGDVGRKFKAIFTDSGLPYDLAGNHFSVFYSGTSGEGNYTHIGENSAFTVDKNTVTVEIITQMLTNPGDGLLCLIMSRATGETIGTWNISYSAEVVPGSSSEAAQDYYTAFSQSASELAAHADKASQSAAAANASANQTAKDAATASASAKEAAQSAASAAESAKSAADAALSAGAGSKIVVGQGLTTFSPTDGGTGVEVSNDIRYSGHEDEQMVVGLDTQSGSGIEGVELSQTASGDRVARLVVRTTNDRTGDANVAAGIELGTVAGGIPNAVVIITNGGMRGYVSPKEIVLYAHGTEPVLSFDDTHSKLQLGCVDGTNLSIAAGDDGSTGIAGQVLTANGDGTCQWASLPAVAEYDGTVTIA